MRCSYCYNPNIVEEKGEISALEFLEFLKTRRNLLDGVVLSGGECTLYPHLKELCKEIKKLKFDIKIDTNGTNLELLKELVKLGLVDYIALDFKATKAKFENITKSNFYEKTLKTLEFLIDINFNFEARTTIHSNLLNHEDINEIIKTLYQKGYKNTYFLQNFLDVENLGNLKSPSQIFDIQRLENLIPLELRNF